MAALVPPAGCIALSLCTLYMKSTDARFASKYSRKEFCKWLSIYYIISASYLDDRIQCIMHTVILYPVVKYSDNTIKILHLLTPNATSAVILDRCILPAFLINFLVDAL